MATNAIKTPIIRAVANRSYTTKPNPISGVINEIKTTVLPNKMVVSSCDNGSPLARVSVVLKAGSRYECPDIHGVSHLLRITAGLSTRNSTNFAITRNIQQVGANLTCTQGRETIAYTLEGTYEALENCSEYLSDVVSQQCFKPWEVADCTPRLKYELASLSPEARAINFLHRVAFHDTLGNSLFCPKHKVGKIPSETLQYYMCKNFTTNRAAVVGLGINHENLVQYASNLCLESGSGEDAKAKYHGGEIRSDKGGNLAYVAVAGEGASLCNEQQALAFAVLRRVMGVGPYTHMGTESSGLLSKAISGKTCNTPYAISALNASYTDSGLFGFLLVTEANVVGEPLLAAVKTLKCGNISEADIKRAKNQLITSILLKSESGTSFIDLMGSQAVLLGKNQTPVQLACAVEAVSNTAVQDAAKKLASSKLSIASVGNLCCVPYLEELK